MNQSLIAENSPHGHAVATTDRLMTAIMLAMLPALGAHIWYYGFGIVVTMGLTFLSCSLTEILMLKLRGRGIHALWRDRSAWVTAMILGFALPPLLPWYLTVIGSIFAIAVVKHAFGGLGQNIFNPAMAGFVFLLASCPLPMTTYVQATPNAVSAVTLPRAAAVIFNVKADEALSAMQNAQQEAFHDGVSGATFLVNSRHEQATNYVAIYTATHMGSLGIAEFQAKFYCSLMFLLGGIFLMWRRIIDWRIPVSFLGVTLVGATIFWLCAPEKYIPPFWHLSFGATIFCAFFILTDPVTAVSKPRGALIYGATAGLLFIIIRNCGGYPDAAAFCTLTANALAPLITILTVRRPFGYGSAPEDITK